MTPAIKKPWGIMVTVPENERAKIEKATKWIQANPDIKYPQKEPSIYIPKTLVFSKAYRSLSRCALLVYQDFIAKREMVSTKSDGKKCWRINNNGEIMYPYSEAEENGFSRVQFRNAIDELQQKGFIDIRHMGRGGRKPTNKVTAESDATKYWIDDRWQDYDTDAFRPPRKPRKKDTRKDRGWSLYHGKKK